MDCSVLKRLMNREESGGGALGLLSGGKCLLLDCRPFLAHSAGYIRGSVNVRCNTIVRRRAKGSVSLEQILPAEEEVRARLRSGLYSAVIVYDERSPRAESLREDSTVSLVVQALRRNAERTDICLLKGKLGRRRERAAGCSGAWRPGKKCRGRGGTRGREHPRALLCARRARGFARFLCVCVRVRAPEVLRDGEGASPPPPASPYSWGALRLWTPPSRQASGQATPRRCPAVAQRVGTGPACWLGAPGPCSESRDPAGVKKGERRAGPGPVSAERQPGWRTSCRALRLVPRCPAPSSAWRGPLRPVGLDPSSGGGAGG